MRPPLVPAFPGDSDEVRDAEGRVYLLDDVNSALSRLARMEEALVKIRNNAAARWPSVHREYENIARAALAPADDGEGEG